MTAVAEPVIPVRRGNRTITRPSEAAAIGVGAPARLVDVLFRSTAAAPVWLVVRLWLGYEWLSAGLEKLHAHGAASWFGHAPALAGFVHGADAAWANRAKAFGH